MQSDQSLHLFHKTLVQGWMSDLRFYVLFNSTPGISGRWVGNNEKLLAIEPRLRLKKSSPQAGLEPGTARQAKAVVASALCRIGPSHTANSETSIGPVYAIGII